METFFSVVTTLMSALRTISGPVLTSLRDVSQSIIRSVGGNQLARLPGMNLGKRVVTTLGSKGAALARTGAQYVPAPRPIAKLQGIQRSITFATRKKQAIIGEGVSIISRLWAFFQGLFVLVFVYLIIGNLSRLRDAGLYVVKFITNIMTFFNYMIMILRGFLQYHTIDKLDANPQVSDYIVCAFGFVLDLVLVTVQETIVLIGVIVQAVCVFIGRLFMYPGFWILFGLVILVTKLVERDYIDIADNANSFIVTGESAARTASRLINVGLELKDTLMPLTNVAFIYAIGQARLVCFHFCPQEFRASPTGRRLLSSIELPPMDNIPTGPYEVTKQRRRLVDTDTMIAKIKKLRKVVNKLAFGTYLMNLIDLRITGIYLSLLKPIINGLTTMAGPIEKAISKILCMFAGGFICTGAELFNFLAILAVDFINSFTFFKIGYPEDFTCKRQSLIDVDPEQCGNWLDSDKPPGAFFSSLVPEGASQHGTRPRKLGYAEGPPSPMAEEEATYPLLECKPHEFDGSWIETLDGKVVHTSHHNKCPLSRRVFGDEFANVKQFNMMGIHSECYWVCLHGVKYESCHNQYTGHIRRLLGSCTEGLEIKDERQARRRLNSIFPDTSFTWGELFGGHKEPVTAAPVNPFLQPPPKKTGVLTSDDLVQKLRESIKTNPKFEVFGIQCNIKWELNIERMYTNIWCLTMRMVHDHTPGISVYVDQYMSGTLGMDRRKLDEELVAKKRVTMQEWTKDFASTRKDFTDTIAQVRSYVRLLQSTDDGQTAEERIDDMVSVASFRSRRTLLESTIRVNGFDEPELKDIGWCEGEDMYPCPTGGVCVPIADRDLCPVPDFNSTETTVWEKAGYYLNQASLIDIDPEEILQDMNECYRQYEVDMDSVPVTLTNLEQEGGGGSFCVGVIPPFPLRMPDVEVHGINRFVSTGCTVNEVNTCSCDMYHRSLLNYDLFNFYYTDADFHVKIINALVWVHHLFYVVLFVRVPELQDGWYNIMDFFFGADNLPGWFLYLLGDLGVKNVSIQKRWYCWGLHTNSAMVVLAMILLTYELVMSLEVVAYWFWSLARRISYYHHPLFCPSRRKTV